MSLKVSLNAPNINQLIIYILMGESDLISLWYSARPITTTPRLVAQLGERCIPKTIECFDGNAVCLNSICQCQDDYFERSSKCGKDFIWICAIQMQLTLIKSFTLFYQSKRSYWVRAVIQEMSAWIPWLPVYQEDAPAIKISTTSKGNVVCT